MKLDAIFARWFAQPDKALHVAVGFVLALVFASVLNDLSVVALVGLIGWGKERWDKRHAETHTPDGWDAFATATGAVLGLFLLRAVGLPYA